MSVYFANCYTHSLCFRLIYHNFFIVYSVQDYGDGESSDGASYDGEDMLSNSNSSPSKKPAG